MKNFERSVLSFEAKLIREIKAAFPKVRARVHVRIMHWQKWVTVHITAGEVSDTMMRTIVTKANRLTLQLWPVPVRIPPDSKRLIFRPEANAYSFWLPVAPSRHVADFSDFFPSRRG